MKKLKATLPSPSMVVAVIALIAALGGTAVAASLITSKDIQNGTIKKADLSKRLQAQLKKKGAKGDTGAQGPTGPAGPTGPQGPAGASSMNQISALATTNNATPITEFYGRESSCNTPTSPFGDVSIAAVPGTNSATANGALKFVTPNDPDAFAEVRTRQFEGLTLKQFSEISYLQRTDHPGNVGAVYMFINVRDASDPNDFHTVSFAPEYQQGQYAGSEDQGDLITGDWQRWSVTDGAVAYDDPGGVPNLTWDDLIAAHGNEIVTSSENGGGMRLLYGCAGSNQQNATAYADSLRIEAAGKERVFDFGTTP